MKKGIETKYKGTLFRSRTEAKWAAFFDLLGWPWEYEPLDLDGYIPDFILPFEAGPLLVEVKADFNVADLQKYTAKIGRSGWAKEALIVGCGLPLASFERYPFPVMGLLREAPDASQCGWEPALLFGCQKCNRPSVMHPVGSFHCRVNGCWDGDHYLGFLLGANSEERARDYARMYWRRAANTVRWEGGAVTIADTHLYRDLMRD